jgi:OFA family oxalate/formate antiporter-like MFS transporter
MGFGASSLLIGNAASKMMDMLGWQRTFMLLGIALGVVLIVTALVLKKPDEATPLPAPKAKKSSVSKTLRFGITPPLKCCGAPAFG